MGDKLAGKVAAVTGAGGRKGVGRATVLALASEGAKVVVNDFGVLPDGTKAADATVEEVIKAGGVAVANYDSVATMEGGANIVKTAIDNFGRLDILVNSAGNFIPQMPLEATEKAFDLTIAAHVKGHFACSTAAAKVMAEQGGGSIVCMSSRGAFFGQGANMIYATAKAGILGFTASMAAGLKKNNIRVNCVLPSADSGMFPGAKVGLGDNMPLPNPNKSEACAQIIMYLCSDAAKNITGKYFYAAGADFCIYEHPLLLSAGHKFFRKANAQIWTLDELEDVISDVLSIQEAKADPNGQW